MTLCHIIGSFSYFRIYTHMNGFYYSSGVQNVGNNFISTQEIEVTDNWLYRNDCSSIFLSSFILIFAIVILFNIVTSMFKKGGLFGGLV